MLQIKVKVVQEQWPCYLKSYSLCASNSPELILKYSDHMNCLVAATTWREGEVVSVLNYLDKSKINHTFAITPF
jgi:hypothetical protein